MKRRNKRLGTWRQRISRVTEIKGLDSPVTCLLLFLLSIFLPSSFLLFYKFMITIFCYYFLSLFLFFCFPPLPLFSSFSPHSFLLLLFIFRFNITIIFSFLLFFILTFLVFSSVSTPLSSLFASSSCSFPSQFLYSFLLCFFIFRFNTTISFHFLPLLFFFFLHIFLSPISLSLSSP